MSRPYIAGWRQRRGLSLLMLDGWSMQGVRPLFKALSDARLNLSFVLLQESGDTLAGGLGLDEDNSRQAAEVARHMAGEHGWPEPVLHQSAAALVLYPLAGELALLAEVLAVLATNGLAPLALGTSPAALSLILSDTDLPGAMSCLRAAYDLTPEPQQEVVNVVQSSRQREP